MNKKLVVSLFLTLIGLVSAVSNFRFISVAISLYFVYITFSYFYKSLNTIFYKLVISIVLYTAVFQVGSMIAWLINSNPFVISFLLCAIGCLLLVRNKGRFSDRAFKFMDKDDLIAALIAVAAVTFVFGMATVRSGYTSAVLNTANTNHDDISHLSLIQTVHQNNGLVYGTKDETVRYILLPALTAYPQGWHVSQLPFISVLENLNIKTTPWNWQVIYAFLKLFWFAILLFIFTRTALRLAISDAKKSYTNSIVRFTTASIMTATACILLFNNVFALGFFNFFGVLIYVLTAICLIFYETDKKTNDSSRFDNAYIIVSALLIAAGFITWIISGVLLIFILSVPLIIRLNSLNELMGWAKKYLATLLLAVTIMTIGFIQMYVQVKYTIKTDALNEGGGINKIVGLIYLIAVSISCAVLYFNKKSSKLKISSLIALILTALVSLLYFYQIIKLGEARYYAIKLSYIPFLLLTLVASSLFIVFAERVKQSQGLLAALSIAVIPIAVIPIAFDSSFGATKSIISGSSQIKRDLAQTLKSQLNSDMFKDNSYIVYLGRSSGEDQAATRILNLGTRYYGGCDNEFTGLLYDMPANQPYIKNSLEKCYDSSRNTVFILSESTISTVNNIGSSSIVKL